MHKEGPGFAVIGEDGIVVHVAETYDEALARCVEIDPKADVWYEGPPPWEEDEPPAVAATAIAANAVHRIRSKNETEPERALALTGLAPMVTRQILDLDLESAFRKIRQFFPTLSESGSPASTYDTADSMVEHVFGTNHKTSKPTARGFKKGMSTGLNMLPSNSWTYDRAKETIEQARPDFGVATVRLPPRGSTVCASATKQCKESCLVFSGRNVRDYATIKKLALTTSLFHEPLAFARVLYAAIQHWQRKCECDEATAYLRLNVYSDIPWELLIPDMFQHFHTVQFYDYTKVSRRMNMVGGKYPIPNYDLTFSYSGSATNLTDLEFEIKHNRRRVAIAFCGIGQSKYIAPGGEPIPTELPYPGPSETAHLWPRTPEVGLPKEFMGLPVVDGDRHDFRPLDPRPCIVGLRWKTPKLQGVTAEKARLFIVPGYLVDEAGREDERGKHFVVMDLPRYKDVFGRGVSPRWQGLDFSSVTIEEAD